MLVLRRETERPEAVAAGTVLLAGTEEEVIYRHAARLLTDPAAYEAMAKAVNPLWGRQRLPPDCGRHSVEAGPAGTAAGGIFRVRSRWRGETSSMEQKNRTILVIAIAITVFAAVFVSIGLPALTGRAPEVLLPDVNQEAVGEEDKNFLPVEVTPGTVQSVIASLSRPESYYRPLRSAFSGREGSLQTRWKFGPTGTMSARPTP